MKTSARSLPQDGHAVGMLDITWYNSAEIEIIFEGFPVFSCSTNDHQAVVQ
jgi:hypothetical protein